MSLALMPPTAARRGRPEVSTVPVERLKHLAVAQSRLCLGQSVTELARNFDVKRHTVTRWVRLALTYPEGRWMRDLPGDEPR